MDATNVIKLPTSIAREYREIPILFEDDHILALDKPAGLFACPDRNSPNKPTLIQVLRKGVSLSLPWAQKRGLTYLMHCFRLDVQSSGVILFAKSRAAFVALAAQFNSEQPNRVFAALVRGVAAAEQTEFKTDAKLAPNPVQLGMMRVDTRNGQRARTNFLVLERFDGYMLMECRPLTYRPSQLPVHLRHVGFKLVGDDNYGGPPLFLSSIKSDFRLKPGHHERPLIARPAMHAASIVFKHPATGAEMTITSPLEKDFSVAVKYLRRFASTGDAPQPLGGS